MSLTFPEDGDVLELTEGVGFVLTSTSAGDDFLIVTEEGQLVESDEQGAGTVIVFENEGPTILTDEFGNVDVFVIVSGGPPGPPGPPGPMGPPGSGEGTLPVTEYQMPLPATTVSIDHELGRDPVAIQVFVEGQICRGYGVYFTIPNEQVQLGFDVPVAALIRIM